MNKCMYVIETVQPIGYFYIGKINAEDLISISITKRRSQEDGIQRDLSISRTTEIQKYCDDPDAAFPTPIILSISMEDCELVQSNCAKDIYEFNYNTEKKIAEILDGQHRLEGIKKSKGFNYDLPIVLMFDLTEEEKAYVFSTINSNQTKVSKSLIYDLFELSTQRSPYKTCHEIARILNSEVDSPFFCKLKMLGKKASEMESLSQGTFVTHLCKLISSKPKEDMIDIKKGEELNDDLRLPFRKYFIKDKDEIILKILDNYFSAAKEVFEEEWNNPDKYILSKTTGFGALLLALKTFYFEGHKKKDLTKKFFLTKLEKSKENLLKESKTLTSVDFPSNEAIQGKLAKIFVK